jgi:hypothetical protein
MNWIRAAAIASVVAACGLRHVIAEKVMFRDELTGCEMWRISSFKVTAINEDGLEGSPAAVQATTAVVKRDRLRARSRAQAAGFRAQAASVSIIRGAAPPHNGLTSDF